MALAASTCVWRSWLIMKSAIFAQYNVFKANVYMCYDYVHLDNLADISSYRNHNVFLCPVHNQLQSRGVSPFIVTRLQALYSS